MAQTLVNIRADEELKKYGEKIMEFITQVTEQLKKMSEWEKDQWILERAKLLAEDERQGFLMTLSGEKKIAYMPSLQEIEEFCQKAASGEIYVEHEKRYFEFDENGRYLDDWKTWHNDPLGAMDFVDRVLRGCRDLLILGEYKAVSEILDKVCKLSFRVVDISDSEDFEEESLFTLKNAGDEGMISRNLDDIGKDWITAAIYQKDEWDDMSLAGKLVELFEHPACRRLNPDMFIGKAFPKIFFHMQEILGREIQEGEADFKKRFSCVRFSREMYKAEKELERKKEIALNIRLKCINHAEEEKA